MSFDLKDHNKKFIENKEFSSDIRDENIVQHSLYKVYAVKRTFRNVSFLQTDFNECYFRKCRFIECDFTGCKIINSNFRGSQFEDCKFRYSIWENTELDDDFLDNCLPSEENLARDLVRTLRVNFSQIGNYEAVNKAASTEVQLTGKHFYSAAYSKEAYYRSKYKGFERALQAIKHMKWKALDLLWGNGESLLRVILSTAFFLVTWALLLAKTDSTRAFPEVLSAVFKSFLGVSTKPPLPELHEAGLTALQLIAFGLFIAILVKRLARR